MGYGAQLMAPYFGFNHELGEFKDLGSRAVAMHAQKAHLSAEQYKACA